jgi:hypothetical protein
MTVTGKIEQLFLELTEKWQQENYPEIGWDQPQGRRGVFGAALTIWLMMLQGIEKQSMSGVLGLIHKGFAELVLARNVDSRKARLKDIASSTGGYSRAKSRLPLVDVEDVVEVINEGLIKRSGKDAKRFGCKVYALDGTDFVVERSEDNKKTYATRRNQHGELNHPELKATFATDVITGIAVKPEFGAASVGEVALSARVIEKIEAGALIIADRGVGLFSVASHATQHNKQVLLRMREKSVRRFLKDSQASLDQTVDISFCWTRSIHDKTLDEANPEEVNGRLIRAVLRRDGFREMVLYFFTTSDLSVSELVELYGERVHVETDFRYLKHTFKMERVYAKTPEALQKELLVRMVAYNLLRRVIADGGQHVGLEAREISFTKAAMYTSIFGDKIAAAQDAQEKQRLYAQYLKILRQCKLPNRGNKHRHEPRMVTRLSTRKSVMKGSRDEARKRSLQREIAKIGDFV